MHARHGNGAISATPTFAVIFVLEFVIDEPKWWTTTAKIDADAVSIVSVPLLRHRFGHDKVEY